MRILALDMATITGWAISDDGIITASGVLKMYDARSPDRANLYYRLNVWLDSLTDLTHEYQPDVIVYERAHFRGGAATRSALGMETVLCMQSYRYGTPCFPVHSQTLKKWACGSGKATKEDMIRFANGLDNSHIERNVIDDNEADAICLAAWGGANVEYNNSPKHRIDRYTLKHVANKKRR